VALRIVFCGTPAFALPALRALIAQRDFEIAGVITQPDRPAGRGRATSFCPVKAAALEANIPIFQPEKIKAEEAFEYLQQIAADAVVIIAYGQIIPARLITIPRLGWINLHGSLLPKYRGAAPINWAIINGETRTGLTTMQINPGMDTGPMLLKYETEIGPDETAPQLAARLAEAGAPLMVETLRKFASGEIQPIPQDDSQKTFAPLLKKEHGLVDWSLSAQRIYNRIRGLQPWPGTFTTFRGKTCHIWGKPAQAAPGSAAAGIILPQGEQMMVACGEGTALALEFLQMEGRKRVTAREFANGARLGPGEKFGD
jgi:methionyl-tRNA formyltransferase